MNGLLSALASLGAVALLVGLGFAAGHHQAGVQCQGQRAQQQLEQTQAVDKAVAQARADGDATVHDLRQQLQHAAHYQAQLQERRRHAPLTVVKPTSPLPAPAPRAAPAGSAAAAAPAAPPAAATAADGLAEAAAGPVLTLAAVSLWNSALAGADVPAGACRVADAAQPACAADAGITLAHAWDNQAENAAACAADRQRYTALIELLCRRAGQPGCPPPTAGELP